MKTKRLIKIIGSISEESYKQFSDELDLLENESVHPIRIELSSGGGTAYDALAFCARMRTSKCYLHVHVFGYVASAAVLVLAAGDRRFMTKEAWVMVHEDTGKLKGNVVELEREAGHLRRLEQQWAYLLSKRTTTSYEDWCTMHKATTYLSSDECLKLGLIDEII